MIIDLESLCPLDECKSNINFILDLYWSLQSPEGNLSAVGFYRFFSEKDVMRAVRVQNSESVDRTKTVSRNSL